MNEQGEDEEYSINRFYVAKFDCDIDGYSQHSIYMSLPECRKFLKSSRENNKDCSYIILGVLSE
jgi:hypothetical protein